MPVEKFPWGGQPYAGMPPSLRGREGMQVTPNKQDDALLRVRLPSGKTGKVVFQGTTSFAKGAWVGLELEEPGAGKHDGAVDGVRYFTCPTGQGLFVRPEAVGLTADASLPAASKRLLSSPAAAAPSKAPAQPPRSPTARYRAQTPVDAAS